ncbi:MAG TPA: hypothetical protein VIG38_16975 [Hyphomicrobium sp.]
MRFPLDAPVPARLITRIAKYRAQEVAARKQLKTAKRAAIAKKRPPAAKAAKKR